MSNKVDILLNSDERKQFDTIVAQFADQNTPKVTKAYATTHWPKGIGFKFPEFIHKVINYYMEYCVTNNVYYTNNQEQTWLGDPFFKFIFIKFTGNTNRDLGLRDHIWSTVSACMSIGDKYPQYEKFWKPATYLTTSEEKQELIKKIESPSLIASVGNKGTIFLIMGVIGVLLASN